MNWEEKIELAAQDYLSNTGFIPTYVIVQPHVFHEILDTTEDPDFTKYHELNGLKVAVSPKIYEPFILLQRQDF